MGRLQRKKTTSQKLKKKQKLDVEKTGISPNKTVLNSVPVQSKKTQKKQALEKQAESEGIIARSVAFLREARAELNKVTWPTRSQTIASTVVVIVLVIIISFFLGVVDAGLSGIVRTVLN